MQRAPRVDAPSTRQELMRIWWLHIDLTRQTYQRDMCGSSYVLLLLVHRDDKFAEFEENLLARLRWADRPFDLHHTHFTTL